jgi:hypothetical protein
LIEMRPVSVDLEIDHEQAETVVAKYTLRYERNVRLRWAAFTIVMLLVCIAAGASPERRSSVLAASRAFPATAERFLSDHVKPMVGAACVGRVASGAIASVRIGADVEHVEVEKERVAPDVRAGAVVVAPRSENAKTRAAGSEPSDDEMKQAVDLLTKAQGEAALK